MGTGAISVLRRSVGAASLMSILLAFELVFLTISLGPVLSTWKGSWINTYLFVCLLIHLSLHFIPALQVGCESAPSLSLNYRKQKYMGRPFIESTVLLPIYLSSP